ncbi:unnamed protein product [Ectocarpus sp. 6 AP-2014]
MNNFPPGLLNPGVSTSASVAAAGWCVRVLGVECPTGRELIFNVFFTGYGVWMLLPLSIILLLVYRLVGPPEVDEREELLRQQWVEHRQRFKSGAKRSTLRGVIKSSYLTELSDRGGGAGAGAGDAVSAPGLPESSSSLVSHANPDDDDIDDDSSWEDVRVAATAAAAAELPPPPRETVSVLTTPGPTRVTIVGDRGGGRSHGGTGAKVGGAGEGGGSGGRKRLAVLTLHAAGHNHRTCLGGLEREVAKDEELGAGGVVLYHVDTPGHEEEQAKDVEAKALSLEAQAAQLLEVTIQLGLEWFVGLGIGAGANVLLRFACDNPGKVAGLILANASGEAAGRRERNAWLSPRFRLSWESDMKAAREALVPLSFPPHSSLGNRYRAGLGTMHSGNVLKYVDASLCRDDIPVSRLQALNDVWTLLICGKESTRASSVGGYLTSMVAGVDSEEASRSLLDKLRRAAGGEASKATLVTLDGGGSGGGILEAKPLEVLSAMKLFLNKCL